jgi:cobalt-zinc-cadmium efflux system membrane fusion protein
MLLTVLVLASCTSPKEDNTEVAATDWITLNDEQVKNAGITTGIIPEKELKTSLTCNGVLALPPQNLASIHSPVQGFVTPGRWLEGDLIKKGEIMATIQHQDIIKVQQDYLESKGKLNFLKLEFERKQKLVAGDATSNKLLEESESNYLAEKARVAGLSEQLRFLGLSPEAVSKGDITSTISIRAPFTGHVSAIKVNQGMLVAPNQLLYEIVDKSHMHVEIAVFAADAPMVKEGQQFDITLPGKTEKLDGVIHLVGQKIDDNTKAVNMHGHLDKEDIALLPGNFVQTTIYTGIKTTKTLSREGLVEQAGKFYAFISTPEGYKKVLATVGMQNDTEVEILKLEDYDLATTKVVLTGAYYLNAGGEE